MHYYFCNAYLHLYYALDFEINQNKDLTVITRNKAIFEFCKFFNKRVYFYEALPKQSTFKLLKYLKYLFKIKKETIDFINYIELNNEDSIVYPSKYFNIYEAGRESFFLKKISKNNNVFISNIIRKDLIKSSLYHYENFFGRLRLRYIKLFYYLVYGTKFNFYKLNRNLIKDNKTWLGYSKKYIKSKSNISILESDPDYQKIVNRVISNSKKVLDENYDHLIIYDGDGEVDHRIIPSSLEDLYNYLFSKIENYAIKRTPKISVNLNNSLNIDIEYHNNLPSYIPAEFYLKNINKSILSISSSTLINASLDNKLNVISLLELVTWKDNGRKIVYKKTLKKYGKNILFPQSRTELISLLKY